MECHRCEYHEAVEAGKYVGVPFELTPCSKCDLQELSIRTIEFNVERPVDVQKSDGAENTQWQAGAGVHWDVPFPEEEEAAEATIPLNLIEEFITRLLGLPECVRDVVCLRFIGLTYPEIARKQEITTAGAESRHKRAMRLFPELRELFILKTMRQRTPRAEAGHFSGTSRGAIGG